MTAGLTELRRLQTLQTKVNERRLGAWWDNPVKWVNDVLPDVDLADYQAQELAALAEHRKVAVRGPRGSGKTMPASMAFWWFATTRELAGVDWKLPTTAGSWHQVALYLWPEIHRWYRDINWQRVGLKQPTLGKNLLTNHLKWTYGEGFGRATDDPALIEGAHASHMLMVIDEGKSVVDGIWDATEGFFANPGEHYALALSTPGAPAGRFYEIHSRKMGYEEWHPIHVTIDQALNAGRIRPEWVEARKLQWGEDSRIYRSHVLAEFAGEEDGVLPLSWVEQAIERWRALDLNDYRPDIVSVDVSDGGEDDTVIALRHGTVITKLVRPRQDDVLHVAELAENRCPKGGTVIVDSIGVGAGVLAHLARNKNLTARGFVASERTNRKDRTGEIGFSNKRAAAWWNLREMLDPNLGDDIALPDDDYLMGDLTSPQWREMSGGRIAVESKADIKKRLGRSTDAGDAVVMAFWGEKGGRRPVRWESEFTRDSPWRV